MDRQTEFLLADSIPVSGRVKRKCLFVLGGTNYSVVICTTHAGTPCQYNKHRVICTDDSVKSYLVQINSELFVPPGKIFFNLSFFHLMQWYFLIWRFRWTGLVGVGSSAGGALAVYHLIPLFAVTDTNLTGWGRGDWGVPILLSHSNHIKTDFG